MGRYLTRRTWLARAGVLTAAWSCSSWVDSVLGMVRSQSESRPVEWELRGVLERAAGCCLAWLDPQHGWLPTGGYEIAHDTGRWWDAMLKCQATIGSPIPALQEAAMLENLQRLTDNPAGLLTNDSRAEQAGGIRQVNPHNFRESMLAYSALVKWRNHAWSREHGAKLVDTTRRMLLPDGQMDYVRLAELMQLPLNQDPSMIQRAAEGQWFDATGSTGRALEGFVWFHEVTGSADAMELAGTLAAVHRRHVTREDGNVPPEILNTNNVGHNHSYLGTLRGLLRYGLSSGRSEFVEAVAQTYRCGLFGTVVSESGWTPHDLGKSRFPNEHGDPLGEHGSCADVVQLALWLATQCGQVDLWDDVERLLRARILPSQIDDLSQPRRHGAWGVYGHPFERGCILDVFAAVLSMLTEVYRSAVTTAPDGTVSVNLHFTMETTSASVQAQRDEQGCTSVKLTKPVRLRVRLPAWSPAAQARITVGDKPLEVRWEGAYAVVPADAAPAGMPIQLHYDLPARTSVETLPVSGQQYRLTWRGDDVVACSPPAPIYQ